MAPRKGTINNPNGRPVGSRNNISEHDESMIDIEKYDGEKIVYVIRCNDRYKIGRTKNIITRVAGFIGQIPYKIELIHIIASKDYFIIEKGLHRMYKDKQIHYEGFLLDDNDIENIKSIKGIKDFSKILFGTVVNNNK